MTLAPDHRGRIKLSEREIQRQCIEYLRAHGWIVRPAPRNGTKAIRGAFSVPAGEPDLIAVKWNGTASFMPWDVLLIECKAVGGSLSVSQRHWCDAHEEYVHVIRSLDDLKAVVG